MKKILSLLGISLLLFACNPTRNDERTTDRSAYDVITEKCYVYREFKPASNPLTDSVLQLRKELTDYLDQHQYKRHMAGNDSLLFRRENGQEVIIELPTPQDIWEQSTIIVFDPQKNPLFVNLHKDTTQLEHYIQAK
ncbi:hypothetical protein SAMN05660461_4372 [Chitinophaga ginsengisegetis]|uniref:Lipoprotein n=1 Tax=Chitinophaga ginsengisegetis TaxID=393003 RepID=A0A1T5P775_9BACT|nr:hypothetical protein [Chitinophaga ginsengisegetis]SKD08506.1 hypothetical protein SAMN05660461_4372 [Chitinophaga ginsengisegetis]